MPKVFLAMLAACFFFSAFAYAAPDSDASVDAGNDAATDAGNDAGQDSGPLDDSTSPDMGGVGCATVPGSTAASPILVFALALVGLAFLRIKR